MLICAAVKFHINEINNDVVIPCLRHHHAYEIIRDLGFKVGDYKKIEEGFIDTKNNFLNRNEAYIHARECGQLSATVRQNINNNILFSEDLY